MSTPTTTVRHSTHRSKISCAADTELETLLVCVVDHTIGLENSMKLVLVITHAQSQPVYRLTNRDGLRQVVTANEAFCL